MGSREYPSLWHAAFTHPAVDNHAHPLLRTETRDAIPFEGLISEASGAALIEDATQSVSCFRATKQLARLYGIHPDASWEDVKKKREATEYKELCQLCFRDSGIQSILIDDGLGGVRELAEEYHWHDQFTKSPTRRIVRVEPIAEKILDQLFGNFIIQRPIHYENELETFKRNLRSALIESANDKMVVGFKSVVCYRTGLNVLAEENPTLEQGALENLFVVYSKAKPLRLESKPLNDVVVRTVLEVAGAANKPVQFHTGLGDNDMTLSLSSPAHLQPVIKAFPKTTFVLLHASYPFTREAGYLTAVYKNVYLDFGEVFPLVSAAGQRAVIRQVLELAPTNKIMWSSDGHWWPESYYLGILQAREGLYEVLAEMITKHEISESQGVAIVQKALFDNANGVYFSGGTKLKSRDWPRPK